MLRQLNNLTKFTTSSLRYAANNTAAALVSLSASSRDDQSLPSPQLVAYWISETQRGLDAFFNDDFEVAQEIFMQHHEESPFHAVGFALMSYVEAILGFETEKIQLALDRIVAAETLAKQFAKKARKKSWHSTKMHNSISSSSSSSSNTNEHTHSEDFFEDAIVSIAFEETAHSMNANKKYNSSRKPSPELQYELLAANCMIMASTIQFMRNSWIEYMKAAYKLRKAYKLYEQMFESVTGQKTSEYAFLLEKKPVLRGGPSATNSPTLNNEQAENRSLSALLANSTHVKASWNDKRLSLFHIPSTVNGSNKLRRRPFSSNDLVCSTENIPETFPSSVANSFIIIENAVESGIFFGIGLFSLIFSLLPPKVNKILNTLGFHSSRPFALHLLQRSFKSQGLYSSLSALSLLAYYTNLSLFIHPQLLPNSLSLENARRTLDQMKHNFPQGKIWKLLEGKLCKMEGKTRRGVEILRDTRRRETTLVDTDSSIPDQTKEKKTKSIVCELVQLQALAVHEMGWGQVFLGDYFQAAETFFRLESMNNWSRAFYHYTATCCMFADEEYEKSASEFMQIPIILKRKRDMGGRLSPNEIFAERRIKYWKKKYQQFDSRKGGGALDGSALKLVVVVHPLWELIYLWNGFSQLTPSNLQNMKQSIETSLATLSNEEIGTDMSQLYLLLGVSVRELGDFDLADMYLRQAIRSEDPNSEDRWVIPYVLYEMAVLRCFQLLQTNDVKKQIKLHKEAHEWIRQSERHLVHRGHSSNANGNHSTGVNGTNYEEQESVTSDNTGDSDWDSRLHVRCQLLLEKLEDFYPK